uniref:Cell differentiation protein RCD1 n=1 Tax=Anthurium amnicola TaxID=1678845 RepID=A0A1D1YM96_9ARAE
MAAECGEEDPSSHDHDDRQEEPWEERTLNLLEDSKIDQEFSEAKARKKGGKKHKLKWMKRPMAVPQVILEFLDVELRENAIRALGNFLLERWKENPDDYHRAGFLLFHSCSTMSILLQEVLEFLGRMNDNNLNVRAVKRLANVLTLFQSVAANKETRRKFMDSCIPNFLIPIILFKTAIEVFENIRAIALSVIGIMCQGKEPEIIVWAIENDIIEVCHTIIKTGNELSKVISMHILEYILRDPFGIYVICHPNFRTLEGLMETWNQMVTLLANDPDFSPRLFFHILRCFVLLCAHSRGILVVSNCLPAEIAGSAFYDIAEEFPVIRSLLCQLLLNVGLIPDKCVQFLTQSCTEVVDNSLRERCANNELCSFLFV